MPSAPRYDLVILNGRVIDPESRFDGVAHLGIANGKIQAIEKEPLQGEVTIDADGLIVSPGFIDLHSHGQTDENYRHKAMDGVTAALEMEVGVGDIDTWYARRANQSLIHYGATVGHIPVRMRVMKDPGSFLPRGDAADRKASETELEQIMNGLRRGLERGALGVGLGIQYTPAATREEIVEVFRTAAEFRAGCYVHLRYMGTKPSASSVEGLEEVISAAETTGAPLHVVHVQSSGLRATPELLERIGEARARGLDVTTECYPYPAAMTELESAIFSEGWQEVLGIDYGQLQWAATGERLTAETFAKYRKQGGLVIMFMIPEEIVEAAVVSPLTMIASDGLLENGKGHPRSAGTYSRVLGRFVREQQKLTWMEALRKMTLAPAQRLEARMPVMKNKGRIRVGADADLTVFDPERVIDRATFEKPATYSEGIEYVLVGGAPVVFEGELRTQAAPGRPIRAALP